MIRRLVFLLIISLTTLRAGASGILNQLITIEIKSTPVKTILETIEYSAQVVFSYNPDLVDENRIVSLSIQNKTIEYGLTLIFSKNIRFKEVGNHIILLRNEEVQELRARKKLDQTIVFKGIIKNKQTGVPLQDASVYEVDSRIAAVSDINGFYQLRVPVEETVRSLYIRKKGFKEFVLVLDVSSDSIVTKNIFLEPEFETVEKLTQRTAEPIYLPIEERALSGGLVSYDTYVHTENLPEINEMRVAQISLVPSVSIGSNLSTNGLITNQFSLNLLAGYANGLAGVEIGGILNMDKGDVKWAQVAGVCNMVGGSITGVQVGGVLNSVRGNGLGVQIGGISNMLGGNFKGVQVAGITNLSHKNVEGVQVSGISSLTVGHHDGGQISGIFSAARCGFNGLQLSGITSVSDSVSYGLQLSGIHNMSIGHHNGMQVAGISNYTNKGVNFLQIGGIANRADVNSGLQLAGIFNYAKKNNGLQVGLINLSENSQGITLGLFNFVKNGFHKTELAYSETFPINLTFKSGVRYLYNTYSFSVLPQSKPVYAGGLGIGSNLTIHNKWSLSIDALSQTVFENNFVKFEFSSYYKISTTVDFQVAKWLTIFAGPTFNVNVIHFKNNEGIYTSEIGNQSALAWSYKDGQTKIWIGSQFGLRF